MLFIIFLIVMLWLVLGIGIVLFVFGRVKVVRLFSGFIMIFIVRLIVLLMFLNCMVLRLVILLGFIC